jgi:hypothetical protein
MRKKVLFLVVLAFFGFSSLCLAQAQQRLVLFNQFNVGPFALNSAKIDKAMKVQILAAKISPQTCTVEVIGFTDASGPVQWNKKLAFRRAEAVFAEIKKIYPSIRVGQMFARPFDGQKNLVNYRFCRVKVFVKPGAVVAAGLLPQLLENYKQLQLGQAEIRKNLELILEAIRNISAPSAHVQVQAASLTKILNAIQTGKTDFGQILAELKNLSQGQKEIKTAVQANSQRIEKLEQKIEVGINWLQILHYVGWAICLLGFAGVIWSLTRLTKLFPRTEKIYFYVGDRNFVAKVKRDNLGWHNPVRTQITHKQLKDLKRSLASDVKVYLRYKEEDQKPSEKYLENGIDKKIQDLIERGVIREVKDENDS